MNRVKIKRSFNRIYATLQSAGFIGMMIVAMPFLLAIEICQAFATDEPEVDEPMDEPVKD
jgi:hypothetical protein